jgi:hypothetical protein
MCSDALGIDDPRLKVAHDNILILEEWILYLGEKEPKTNDTWFAASMLKSARRAYNHLHEGWRSDSTYTAWACRNLLELRVFARFIVGSAANRARFLNDWFIDMEQTTDAQKKVTTQQIASSDTSDHDLQLIKLRSMKASLGLAETQYLKVGDLAAQLGLDAEFRGMNKLCSKLVHPTAQSILSIEFDDQSERDTLLLIGCSALSELLSDVAAFVQTLG